MDQEIGERQLDAQLALVHRRRVAMPDLAESIGAAFRTLMEHGAATGARWVGPPFILYPEDCAGEFEIAVCMPVAPGVEGEGEVSLEKVPGGRVVSTVHVGPYESICEAYEALQRWIADNGRRPAGGMREVYLDDPDSTPSEKLRTEIDWSLAEDG